MTPSSRRRLLTLLKIAAGVGVLAYLVHFVEWSELAASAASARPLFLTAALLLLPLNLVLEVTLWHRLISQGGTEATMWDSFAAVLCGHSAGIATPARSGEVVVRALYARDADVWRAGALAVVHRLFDLHAAALVGAPAALVFTLEFNPRPLAVWVGVIGGGFFLLIASSALIANPLVLRRLSRRWLKSPAWSRRLEFLTHWSPADGRALAFLAFIRYCVYTMQFALLVHAFGQNVPWQSALLAGAVIFFAKLLVPPVTFTDVGIREGVAVYVVAFLSISSATAFNAAFTLFVINLVLPSLMGAPLLLRARHQASPVPLPADDPGAAQ